VLLDKDLEPFAPITLTRRGSLFYNHRTGLMDVYTAPIDPSTGDVTGQPANAANRFLGSNLGASWSPDGNTLVFASWRTLGGPGRNILVFHSMDTGLERDVTSDLDSVSGVSWSPDGRFVSVAGPDRKGVRAFRLMDPASGRIVTTLLAQTGNSGAWDPDGAHVYVGNTGTGRISRLDVGTGEEVPVYEAPPDSVLGNLSVSPDGRWLAFGLFLRSDKSARLRLIPSSGGGSRDLVNIPEAGAALRVGGWTRDGRQILFVRVIPASSEHGQIGELWAAPFGGGPTRSLGLSQPALRDVRVSPAGDRISFTTGFPNRDIWVFENFLPKAASR
jgi:Tol biopolymer transport system component